MDKLRSCLSKTWVQVLLHNQSPHIHPPIHAIMGKPGKGGRRHSDLESGLKSRLRQVLVCHHTWVTENKELYALGLSFTDTDEDGNPPYSSL